MTTTIGGSYPAVNSDSDATINGLTVGKGNGAYAHCTAVGYQALNSLTADEYATAFGYNALKANTSGADGVAFGYNSLVLNTTGSENSAFGTASLAANVSGSYNTAIGSSALNANTTASNNTAVGYQAGYSNNANASGAFFGYQAGYSSTGDNNTFIGAFAGYSVTGAKNTILGRYNGNMNGLDIRTASNYIVLSDGDGNPSMYSDTPGYFYINCPAASRYPTLRLSVGTATKSQIYWDNTATNLYVVNSSGGVYLTNTGTSWTAVSDETRKVIIEPITDGLNKVATLRTVIGRLKTDTEDVRRPYLIAQDIQKVLPEAVSESEDEQGKVLGLSYTEVIPLLVNAIQELNATVVSLQAQVTALTKA